MLGVSRKLKPPPARASARRDRCGQGARRLPWTKPSINPAEVQRLRFEETWARQRLRAGLESAVSVSIARWPAMDGRRKMIPVDSLVPCIQA